jgi:hypothetical protein
MRLHPLRIGDPPTRFPAARILNYPRPSLMVCLGKARFRCVPLGLKVDHVNLAAGMTGLIALIQVCRVYKTDAIAF